MSAEQDIEIEKSAELLIANYFAAKYRGLIEAKQEGRDKEKDFRLFFERLIEIKHDKKAQETGNMYFEVNNCKLGEPSGLKATKAHIWLHFVPPHDLFYYSPVKMLKHLRDQVPINSRYTHLTNCGDSNSDGVIVPIEEIRALPFVKVEHFTLSKSPLAAA